MIAMLLLPAPGNCFQREGRGNTGLAGDMGEKGAWSSSRFPG